MKQLIKETSREQTISAHKVNPITCNYQKQHLLGGSHMNNVQLIKVFSIYAKQPIIKNNWYLIMYVSNR